MRRGFAPIIIIIAIIAVGIAGIAFYKLKSKNPPKTNTTVQTIKPSPIVTTSPQVTKPQDNVEQAIKTPLNYVPMNLSSVINDRFHLDINTISSSPVKPVECLRADKEPNFPIVDLSNVINRVSDSNILKFTKQIENYKFSDEEKVAYSNGSVVILNQGKSSTRTIGYKQICKLNEAYFFMFSGTGPTVRIGGGGSPPSHIAYTDSNGNLTVVDQIYSKMNYITLPLSSNPQDPSIPTSTVGIAYYGCRSVYAANQTEVLIGCGGGDGGAGSSSIFRVDLSSGLIQEKAFCFGAGGGKYAELCYNQSGQVYYQKLQ